MGTSEYKGVQVTMSDYDGSGGRGRAREGERGGSEGEEGWNIHSQTLCKSLYY